MQGNSFPCLKGQALPDTCFVSKVSKINHLPLNKGGHSIAFLFDCKVNAARRILGIFIENLIWGKSSTTYTFTLDSFVDRLHDFVVLL